MKCLALVIGNADYNKSEHKLENSANDAKDFGNKLETLGFEVKTLQNCTGQQFYEEASFFSQELGKYDLGLFYFAGHGLQIEGKNYLTSVDTSFADSSSAKYTSFPLELMIEHMNQDNVKIKIIILDACRDNPLPSQYRSSVQQLGLAPVNAPKGTIIAFSTSPGEKAMDGGAGRNSIYTGALLNHINDENIPIEDFFKRVRTTVYTLSGGKQTSWEHTSLIGNYYFNTGQMVVSANLPYKQEYVADENFQSNGSEIDKIISDLKSHNFYTQRAALGRLSQINYKSLDKNSLFLLGRNILQTAEGGESTAESIMRDLNTWLAKYSEGNINHILNGILFEIYFNSKGELRKNHFNTRFINEIFRLQAIDKYKEAFKFIENQLKPYQNFLYFIPSDKQIALPIEVQFEKFNDENSYRIVSIKMSGVELLKSSNTENLKFYNYNKLIEMMSEDIIVPINMLRISKNVEVDNLTKIYLPYDFKLEKQ